MMSSAVLVRSSTNSRKCTANSRFYAEIPSPVGRLLILGHNMFVGSLSDSTVVVTGIHVIGGRFVPEIEANWIQRSDLFAQAVEQLEEYFSGDRKEFDFPMEIERGTDFQRKVWSELSKIPHGETLSYGDLARKIGAAGASRAVGTANSRNPISIVIPCHRVIGANGDLSGYAGGLDVKRWLLKHESER